MKRLLNVLIHVEGTENDRQKIKKPSKAELEKKYFQEASDWDQDVMARSKKSEKRAWLVAISVGLIAILEAVGLAALAPLKTVEPYVIRVDNNTGVVDVVSSLNETDGEIKAGAQESLDKYWLGQYLRHRESYQWETRSYDRQMVVLCLVLLFNKIMRLIQIRAKNPNAPVAVYTKIQR
ncbi:VirB8/TrbF family protein [Vibrio harveyi]|uniref:VirB8/TrbF family protein n=1 Tax=Vibrio harveyi TaxID=669 RepID=UPI0025B270BE|nr:VirB8/TrbF family protein [Vibrio harveyi]WJT10878.1 VirB8/TrbF family protein [Vibrio harveyi]